MDWHKVAVVTWASGEYLSSNEQKKNLKTFLLGGAFNAAKMKPSHEAPTSGAKDQEKRDGNGKDDENRCGDESKEVNECLSLSLNLFLDIQGIIHTAASE